MVGKAGFEPATFPLSEGRSNHWSYLPLEQRQRIELCYPTWKDGTSPAMLPLQTPIIPHPKKKITEFFTRTDTTLLVVDERNKEHRMQHKPKNIIELWGAYDSVLEIWDHASTEGPLTEEDREHLAGHIKNLGRLLGYDEYIAPMIAYIIKLGERDTDPLVALGLLWVQGQESAARRGE